MFKKILFTTTLVFTAISARAVTNSVAKERPLAVINLVSTQTSTAGVYYKVLFSGSTGNLEQIQIDPCNMNTDCQPPKVIFHQELKMKIINDGIIADGSKIVELGNGYSLEMFYSWGGNKVGKQFRLLLPSSEKEEQKFVDMQLDFDIKQPDIKK